MDNFETPSWDGEKETEKWSSDLINTSKVHKPRKRNKYPKGFMKGINSSQAPQKRKDMCIKAVKQVIRENPDKLGMANPLPPKKKRKKHTKVIDSSQAPKKDICINAENQEITENPDELGMDNSLPPKKKRKKHKKDICINAENQEITENPDELGMANSLPPKKKRKKPKKDICINAENQEITENPDELGMANSLPPKKKRKKHKKDICINVENQEITENPDELGMANSLLLKKKRKKHKKDICIKAENQEIAENPDKMEMANSLPPKRKIEEHDSFENASTSKKKKKLTLREKMEEKLVGARFRFLNEQLYTSKSGDTSKFFHHDEKAFKAYHDGYKQQLEQWPVKPIDLIINNLKKKPSNYIIADFGCGEALIAQSLPNKVYSFDHVALNDHVTVCDMAHTPLKKGSVDVVVFCLSLMGSNLSDYICEANRVLKIGGLLKIAEVESRFDKVEKFIQIICKFGFLCISKDLNNTYFYLFDFRKEKNLKEGKTLPSVELRACYYKKR